MLPMTEFELWASGVRFDRSANWAESLKTTLLATKILLLQILD